jgi:hypothetical protein
MKKQKPKKQTAVKRYVATPKHIKPKATSPKTEPKAKPKAEPQTPKLKRVKPVTAIALPPVVEPSAKPQKSKPVTAVSPPPVAEPNVLSESETLRRIELTLAEAENAVAGTAVQTLQPAAASWVTTEVSELLEELIVTASPKLASTVSRLAYVLCDIMPGLRAVSERADIVVCRKNGVTFGWDRRAEENRAVHSGKRQKSITVS